jgi:nickel/cobalt transporter (NicO) family protein
MVYAVSNGIIVAGLLLTAGMVLGMVTTIAIFAVAAVLLRDRIVHLMDRTARTRERFGQVLELVSAAAIIGFGLWLLTSR